MAQLCEEIIREEILLRLPIKSLKRFESVSKRWNSLISDPEFAQSHLSRNPGNHDSLILNSTNYYRKSVNDPYYCISIISSNTLSETRINQVPYPISSKNIKLIGSINGLISIVCISELDYHFILWNPTIRRYKKIFAPKYFFQNFEHSSLHLFAFGWDCARDDYKLIVKLPNTLQCVVYSTKTDSWIKIFVSKQLLLRRDADVTPSTIVKGCPYWSNFKHILKFEITSNDFRFIQFSNVRQSYYNVINLNDCLGRVEYGRGYFVDVYRFYQESNVWNKFYTFSFRPHSRPSVFFFKNSGNLVLNKKNLYDQKSHQIKNLIYDDDAEFLNGFSYTPSLILIKGMKVLRGRGRRKSLDAFYSWQKKRKRTPRSF